MTRIGKMLKRLGEVDKEIKEYLNSNLIWDWSLFLDPKWAQFNEKYLEVTLEKDNSDLAKSTRKESENEDFNNFDVFNQFNASSNVIIALII